MKFRVLFLFFVLLLSSVFSIQTAAQEKKNGKTTVVDKNQNVSEGKNKKGKHVGEWTTKTKNGVLLETVNYQKGILHGEYKSFHPNGHTQKQGTYENGKRIGEWYLFSAYGDTTEVATYSNDTLHGRYVQNNIAPGRKTSGTYVHGKKNGTWSSATYRAKKIITIDTAYFNNDSLEGTYRKYVNGHLVTELQYQSGKSHGTSVEYFEDDRHQVRRVGYNYHGKADSVYTEYYSSGALKQRSWYKQGQHYKYDSAWTKTGGVSSVTLYAAPDVKSYEEFLARITLDPQHKYYGDDGELDSVLVFYKNGQIKERQIAVATGVSTYPGSTYYQWKYSETGQLIKHGNLNGGARTGIWTWLDSTGKISKQIAYRFDRANGPYRSYYPNGKLKVAGVCKQGFLQDSIVVYNQKGVLIKKGTIQYDAILNRQMEEDEEVMYGNPEDIPSVEIYEREIFAEETIDAAVVEPPPVEQNDDVLTFAEVMPSFPGDSFSAFVQRNLQYPQMEKDAGKTGTVYVQFIVEKDGSISNVVAIKAIPGAPGFTKEAIRVVKSSPRWTPGLMNGKQVRVRVTQPVRFRIE